jgi:GABA(A) receptor-associated protein
LFPFRCSYFSKVGAKLRGESISLSPFRLSLEVEYSPRMSALAASARALMARPADPTDIPFKESVPFPQRSAEAQRIREKFPGRVPAIVERAARTDVPPIDKKKFLVPSDLTIGQFIYVIRKRLNLPPEKALFLFINNTLPTTGTLMRELYAQYVSEDGFLYCTYSGESAFGSAVAPLQ